MIHKRPPTFIPSL